MAALYAPQHWPTEPIQIDLIGAGGTGSQVADQLASLEATLRAIGHPGFVVTLHDGDTVSPSNIGRQRFTRHDISLNKSVVLVHRINAFYGVNWTASPRPVDPKKPRLLPSVIDNGLVITCVDKALFRSTFGRAYGSQQTDALWLDLGNGDTQAQCVIGHLGKPKQQDRVPNIYDLFPELGTMRQVDDEAPSCSAEESIRRQPWPINRVVAVSAMDMIWNLMRSGCTQDHGQFMSLNPLRMTPLPVDEKHWAMLGFSATGRRRKKDSR